MEGTVNFGKVQQIKSTQPAFNHNLLTYNLLTYLLTK